MQFEYFFIKHCKKSKNNSFKSSQAHVEKQKLVWDSQPGEVHLICYIICLVVIYIWLPKSKRKDHLSKDAKINTIINAIWFVFIV